MSKDYYDLLGVSKGASSDDIKKAYRKLAMEYHPDRNQGDATAEAKFKEINEAYEVLSDSGKRQNYDTFGKAGGSSSGSGSGFGGFGGFGSGSSGFEGFGGFSDIFEEFFGSGFGGRTQKRDTRGNDLKYEMAITLEEAFSGIDKIFTIKIQASCDVCNSVGSSDGSKPVTCSTCNGQGFSYSNSGFMKVRRECKTCSGTGEQIVNKCKSCHGDGRRVREQKINCTIPAGLASGTQMRLSGKGEAGFRGAKSGDLYIVVNIHPHKDFKRENNDLYQDVSISMIDATLGAVKNVRSIEGKELEFTIPSGTQPEQTFRIKGKGMSVYSKSARGDMFVKVKVEIPKKISSKQKEILEKFSEEG